MSTPTRPLTQEKDAITELLAVDGSLLLRVRKNAIQRLRRLIYEGVRAIPQQPGLEIGGLCVASKPVAWGLTETVIDFVPVEIQYQYGPRFRACPADRAIFEDAMAQQQTDGESRVVGCFRSHLAVDLQIRTEDRWLMNTVLGERGGFFMLIQPMFDEVCVFSFGPGGTPLDTLPVGRFSLRDGGPEVEKSKRTELPGTAPESLICVTQSPHHTPVVSGSVSLRSGRITADSPHPSYGVPQAVLRWFPGVFAIRRRFRPKATIPPKTPSGRQKECLARAARGAIPRPRDFLRRRTHTFSPVSDRVGDLEQRKYGRNHMEHSQSRRQKSHTWHPVHIGRHQLFPGELNRRASACRGAMNIHGDRRFVL